MDVYNFDQYSPEWWEIRAGKMTGSHAQAIGANGKGLETYVNQIMSEYYSKAEPESFSNPAMQRGLELEPEAAATYSYEHMVSVQTVGFVVYSDFVGVSPDRLVDDDGLAEIKCPIDKTYFNLLLTEKIDSKYIWQIQMQLLVTGRKWCDFVAYNPNFEQSLFVERITPDIKKFDALKKGFESGEKMILEIMNKMGRAA